MIDVMTQQDRNEVRQMIIDIIGKPLAGINGKLRVANNQLANIEIEARKTNSRVNHLEDDVKENDERIVELEKTMPHTIARCPQADTIVELRDNMITTKAMKTSVNKTIMVTGIIIGAIYSLSMLAIKLIEFYSQKP